MKIIHILFLTVFSQVVNAVDFGVSSEDRIAQGDDLSFTSNIVIPDNGSNESAKDAVKLSDGTLVVYNGVFDPVLSVYANNAWSHLTFSGWSSVNNLTYGGIASNDRYVWVTDMETFGSPEDQDHGIIQFDLDGKNPDFRFAEDIEPIDLTLGKDGLLYALYPGGSPGGRFIDVYNPNDATFVKTINLSDIFGHTAHRSIAVDSDSNVYIADLDGDVQMIDCNDNLVHSINVGGTLFDIDIVDGHVLVGGVSGEIFIADLQLQGFQTVQTEDLDPVFNGSGVFILGDSVDTSNLIIDLIFKDNFE